MNSREDGYYMARFSVTPELAATIKAVRLQNKVTAKSIATHINKSAAYFSKLERGDIKSIEETELTEIFRFIFSDEDEFQKFSEQTLNKILDTLELYFNKEEINNQLWFDNYDTVLRLIPIPSTLIDLINERMKKLDISVEKLCKRINANEGIPADVKNIKSIPYNEWQANIKNHKVKDIYIRMKVDDSHIAGILDKSILSSNYVTLQAITFYLLKFEAEKEAENSTLDIPLDDESIMRNAHAFLSEQRFFSLAQKKIRQELAQTKEDSEALLSEFDIANAKLINKIIVAFRAYSELDITRVNEYLSKFVKNLHWDCGFIMKILSESFYELDGLSFAYKKAFLEELVSLKEKYKNLPDERKTIEYYD